jgi:hypothetical protein
MTAHRSAPSAAIPAWLRYSSVYGSGRGSICAPAASLPMLIALRAHGEPAIHAPAAIRNGATVAELEEVIYHAAGYAGFSAAASARDIVREALNTSGMLS